MKAKGSGMKCKAKLKDGKSKRNTKNWNNPRKSNLTGPLGNKRKQVIQLIKKTLVKILNIL